MKNTFKLLCGIVMSMTALLHSGNSSAQTFTFNYTGTVQTWTVPTGITSIAVVLNGGAGGNFYTSSGGCGGRLQCNLAVTPGQVLNICVGAMGANPTISAGGIGGKTASFASGGLGGFDVVSGSGGGGGGGASDIRIGGTALSNRVLCAGGGGGAGANCGSEMGGTGGGPVTAGNGSDCGVYSSTACGSGANLVGGGAAASSGGGAFAGGPLVGGTGGTAPFKAGGGGGGGYFGGGGGYSGGGGGGSSYADAILASAVTHGQGANCTDGSIVISTTCIPPTVAQITGSSYVCPGNTMALSNATGGGVWSSSNTSIAIVGSTGVVTGISMGYTVISYSVTIGGCTAVVTARMAVGQENITTIAGVGTVAGYSGDGGPATIANLRRPHGIDVDAAGNIYIADHENNVIRKVNTSGIITTIAGTGATGFSGEGVPATAAVFNRPYAVTVDAAGNVYTGDGGNHCVRKISTTGIVTTIAGSPTVSGSSGDGGPATAALFNTPAGLTIDASGNIFVCDLNNHRVRKISTSGIVTTVAGNGSPGFVSDYVLATTTKLFFPNYLTIDPSGNLVITDNGNHRIRSVNASTGIITTIAGVGTIGTTGDGGPASIAKLDYPGGVRYDAAGNFYIADYGSNKVRVVNKAGIINAYAGNGTAGFLGDGGLATAARLNQLTDVAFDPNQNLYVCDYINNAIRKVSPTTMTVAPISGASTLCQGVPTLFTNPSAGGYWASSNTAVAVVGSSTGYVTGMGAGIANITYNGPYTCGNMYVIKPITVNAFTGGIITGPTIVCVGNTITLADATGGGTWSSLDPSIATVTSGGVVAGIAVGATAISYTITNSCGITAATAWITVGNPIMSTIAGGGSSLGDGGPATAAQLNSPTTVYLSASGEKYIADYGGNRIRKIDLVGNITTIAGNGIAGSTGDGFAATNARINGPAGVCLDPSGNLYIAEQNGCRIRMVNTSGIITQIAGNGSCTTFGADGSPATASSVNRPVNIISDASGNLYISEWSGNVVRKINTSGLISKVAGGGVPLGDDGPATAANLSAPYGLSLDGIGNLFIGEQTHYRVRKVDLTTGIISTIAGTGVSGSTGDGGQATAALLTQVVGVYANPYSVYIADGNNNKVRRVDRTSGVITTIAGNGTAAFSGDGTAATAAALRTPASVALDNMGNYYIADYLNARIRKVTMTNNSTVAAITGPSTVCQGATISLSDVTSSGIWSSSNVAVGSVDAFGFVTGISGGVTDISYSKLFECGIVAAVKTVTVDPIPATPAAITGSNTVCIGTTTALNSTTGGGIWTSTATAIATVGSSSGIVSGVAIGTATISYTVSNLCGSAATTKVVTVNASSGSISGTLGVCIGASTSLSGSPGGGSWTSGSTSIATVGSASGIVSGIAAGTANITYTYGGGCTVIAVVTVNALPVISGSSTVCPAATTTLSSTGGGTWTSSSTSIATIGSITGTVSGVAPGTTIITNTSTAGCIATKVMTVNVAPAAITPPGAISICVGATTSLADGTPGGTWSSGATGIATVGTTGIVTAVAAGVATISYTNGLGCAATKNITVNITPAALSPASSPVCIGSSVTFTNTVGGGTWTSSASGTASVVGGTVTGVAAGTATITYTIGTCFVIAPVTVNTNPSAITPATAVSLCVGSTASLADPTPGGTWSSGAIGTATVGSTGLVTGVSAGTVNISYTNAAGCAAIKSVTINVSPAPLSPSSATVCTGNTVTLTNTVGGGTWTSSASGIASVTGGVVSGVAVGTATITYTIGTCFTIAPVTVNLSPNAGTIVGPSNACISVPVTFTDAAGGGVWSSSNTSVATVGPTTGIVSGIIAGGTVTISYTVTNGCGTAVATKIITVNTAPTAGTITGLSTICAGTYTMLINSVTGGVWSATNTNATITSAGLLTGVTPGTDTIKYSVITPCGTAVVTKVITVGPYLTAGTISGAGSVCVGSSITLTDPAPGGTWSKTNSTANVTTGGMVTGVTAGTDTIMYTVTASCGSAVASKVVVVNPLPNAGAIVGTASMCASSSVTFTNAATGGTWSHTNGAIASITSGGVFTATASGIDTIKYTVTNSCGTAVAKKTVTIGAALSAGTISGPSSLCPSTTITLTNPVAGGVWSASNARATVSSTGLVTGVTAGVDTIKYTVTASCGSVTATKIITVNPAPNAGTISGPTAICTGSLTTYTNTATGGVWSLTNSRATVSTAGVVTAITAGLDTLKYTVINSCGTAVTSLVLSIGTTVTSAGTISGASAVCIGSSITLTSTATGGTWSATNATASVSSFGVVTGASSGVDTIKYTITGGCGTAVATKAVTVSPAPVAGTIVGPSTLCIGTPSIYTDAASGGVWSFTNSRATVTSTGVVTPISVGLDTLMYTVTTGCGVATATLVVNIGSAVTAGTISGPTVVCVGAAVMLTTTGSGGTWSASNSHATVNSAGIVSGVTTGLDTIKYIVTGSCGAAIATYIVTVNSTPVVGAIIGSATICAGGFTIYTNSTAGGSWSMSNPLATITSVGVLTAISVGVDTVIYTVSNGCGTAVAKKAVTISTAISAGTISGPTAVCVGSAITLTDLVAGGVWSASNTRASVSSSGVVSGLTAGVDTIMYTVTSACGSATATYVISVISPSTGAGSISGASAVCVSSLITLTSSVSGGVWSSSNTRATITTGTGVVTGVTPGIDTISYTITSACGIFSTTKVITINAMPSAGIISGVSSVCVGGSIILTDGIPSGTWSSSNTNATVGSLTGVVTGVTAGTVTISYTVTNACGSASATKDVTVNGLPVAGTITGPDSVCAGTTITLVSSVTGGTWSSGNPNATVGVTGIVMGVSAGTAPISYTVSNSCGSVSAVKIITIVPSAVAGTIIGPSSVCIGSGITLSSTAGGGLWSASNATAMIVGPGIVNGVSVGIDTIYYSVSGVCGSSIASKVISVNPIPFVAPISGPASQFVSTFVTMTDAVAGGIWTSSNPTVASIGLSSGIVSGLSSGVTTLTYTVTNSFGCPASVTALHTVGVGGRIVAASKVCVGATIKLSAVLNGTWSSNNTAIATVTEDGVVTGVHEGNVIIINNVSGSGETYTVTVLPQPVAGALTGASVVYVGSAIRLENTVAGGVWKSSNEQIAAINAGTVTGVDAGIANVNYTVANECGASTAVHEVVVRTHASAFVQVAAHAELKVFPNPNKGAFTVNLESDNEEQIMVVITDVAGRKIKEYTSETNKLLDVSLNNAPGIYMLNVYAGNRQYVEKVIVQ